MPSSSASASTHAANLIRLISLVATLILALAARSSFNSFLEAQREQALAAAPTAPGPDAAAGNAQEANEAAADTLEEKIPPFWLVSTLASSAGAALLGLFISLLAGRNRVGQMLALILACVPGAVSWVSWSLWQNLGSIAESKVGEIPEPWTFFGQLILSTCLILGPTVAFGLYLRSSILDRYVARGFVLPAGLCFVGFLAIWIVMDLTDNGSTFFYAENGIHQLGLYYLVQLPQMVMLVLPITLLLSLLYTLGRMSRSNEIIAMLGAGKSLFTVTKPLLATGLFSSLACLALNYHWAPKAEARRQAILDELHDQRPGKENSKRRGGDRYAAKGWMYRNSTDARTWEVAGVPADLVKGEMRYVAIWWQDKQANGMIFRTYKAASAKWNHITHEWILSRCKTYDYDEFGTMRMKSYPKLVVRGWEETPWHILSSSYNAEYLGVPELTTYLKTNASLPAVKLAPYATSWHFSWAEPFRCLFIVLMATPLGIVHSRRGVLGGVAAAIGIVFVLIFFDGVFLQLGKSNHIPAWLGAWCPNLLLFLVGAVLFYMRSENKELPKLKSFFGGRA
jgi:LPS export ABC transporter permease LptG